MKKTPLETFGQCYIEKVRDDAIEHWGAVFAGNIKGPEIMQLSNLISQFTKESQELIAMLIPKIIDSCLSRSLRLFEQEDRFQIFANEVNLVELSDGLVGELYGSKGWIARFSSQAHDEPIVLSTLRPPSSR